MEKKLQETEIQFTKKQLQSIINLELEKEDGLNEVNQILSEDPNNEEALNLKAYIKADLGETEEAINLYQLILRKGSRWSGKENDETVLDEFVGQSDNHIAYNNLGFEKLKMSQYQRAIKDFSRAIKLNDAFSLPSADILKIQ